LWTSGGWKKLDEVALYPQDPGPAYRSVLRKHNLSNHPTIYPPDVQELLRRLDATEGLQEEDHLALLGQMGSSTIAIEDKTRAATVGTGPRAKFATQFSIAFLSNEHTVPHSRFPQTDHSLRSAARGRRGKAQLSSWTAHNRQWSTGGRERLLLP
jgi:hypothetical protein